MPLLKEVVETTIKGFQRNDKDTGSTDVQIALLSKNIEYLTQHLKANPKDFSARRGLLKMVGKRRRLLNYLNKKDHVAYLDITKRLNLKK